MKSKTIKTPFLFVSAIALGTLLICLGVSIVVYLSALVLLFITWWILFFLSLYRMIIRMQKAAQTYKETNDVEKCLAELALCQQSHGIASFTLDDIPAKDYISLLQVQILREAGRPEDSLVLINTIKNTSANGEVQRRCQEEADACLSIGL